jgi:transcriptional regulator with XRE-family HTH domain
MDAVQREGVGARIAELRKQRGWSQARLAEEAGVSARTVFSVEKGEREPHPSKLRAILDALGVAEPVNREIVMEHMPEDVEIFVRVAVERLCVLDYRDRAEVLAALYPKLLGTISRHSGDED